MKIGCSAKNGCGVLIHTIHSVAIHLDFHPHLQTTQPAKIHCFPVYTTYDKFNIVAHTTRLGL